MAEHLVQNRYAALRRQGKGIRGFLRRIRLAIFWRPHSRILGVNTYVHRPFHCLNPDSVRIGDRCTIGAFLRIQPLKQWFEQRFSPEVCIGNDVYIGAHCEIVSVLGVHIGNGCTLSDYVYINDSSHGLNPDDGLLMDRLLVAKGPILIGDGCFIGRGAVIFSGVEIGANSVVGASAVVTRSIPPYSMVAGNPSSVIAQYDLGQKKWQYFKAVSTR